MIKRLLLIFSICLCITLFLGWQYQQNIARLLVGGAKYFELNTPKQSGFRHSIYSIVNDALRSVPFLPATSVEIVEKLYSNFERLEQNFSAFDQVNVTTAEEFLKALSNAKAGQSIVVAPGVYKFEGRPIVLSSQRSTLPIVITGVRSGNVVFELDKMVGFEIRTQNWHIDAIIFKGICDIDSHCEHAFHLKGDADNVTFTNNDFVNFNAAVKSNGGVVDKIGTTKFPDFVTVLNNRFYNEWSRNTGLPVTPLDIVGGDFWKIKDNFIADFSKELGNGVAYGAFLKGGGRLGSFEGNIVACSYNVPIYSIRDTRVGLSFGGGGTGVDFCQSEQCEFEHQNGNMHNNLIMNCLTDVSIYVNNSDSITIKNNVLLNSLGVDVALESDNIVFENNTLHGSIKNKTKNSPIEANNNQFLNFFESFLEER